MYMTPFKRLRMQSIRYQFLIAAAALLLPAGCTSTGLFQRDKNEIPAADAANPAVRALCMWEPAEGNGLDGLPTRGFAGQILFFTRGSATPVRVDGDVRVYVFDNHGTPEEQGKPIHQFDFRGDAWTVHLQPSTLGPSYQVFIPYVRKQPWHATCGLRVRLTPKEGTPVYSEMVQVTLPGPMKPAERKSAGQAPAPLAKKSDELSNIQYGAAVKHSSLQPAALAGGQGGLESKAQPETAGTTNLNEPARLDPSTAGGVKELKRREIEQLIEEFKRSQQLQQPATESESPSTLAGGEPQRRFRLAPADGEGDGGED